MVEPLRESLHCADHGCSRLGRDGGVGERANESLDPGLAEEHGDAFEGSGVVREEPHAVAQERPPVGLHGGRGQSPRGGMLQPLGWNDETQVQARGVTERSIAGQTGGNVSATARRRRTTDSKRLSVRTKNVS